MALKLEERRIILSDVEYELKSAIEHLEKALDKATILTPGSRGMIRLEKFRVEDILYFLRAQKRVLEKTV